MMKRQMLKWLNRVALGLLAVCAFADEPNAIKSIDVQTESGDRQIVTITLKRPADAPPANFAVNTPPRIAFDFVNTVNDSGKASVPVTGGNLKLVNIAEASGRTRVILSLLHGVSYDTKVDGNKLSITLNNSASTAQVSNATTQFSVAQNKGKESIHDVDFRRGSAGEGRVVVNLSSPNIGIDIRQQGKSLVLEFAKTAMPRQLERRMDVADFGTPVQTIDTYSQGENSKMVIEPKGNWEYSAYQTENRFIVEVRNVDEEAKRIAALDKPSFKGDKLSLNFQNVEVRTVLQVIAEFTQKNIITSDTVTGSLTLRLKDVPWDQALDLILQSKGLDKRENGSVMWIAPRDEIANRERAALESKKQVEDLEPLRSQTFQLNYVKADLLKKILSDDKQPVLSKRGAVVAEPDNNLLFVQDIPSRLAEVEKLVTRLDAPARQVMIEARIVSASDTFGRTLGARLGVATQRVQGNTTYNTVSGFNLAGGSASSGSSGGSSSSSSSSSSSGSGTTSGTAAASGAVGNFFSQQVANVNLPTTGSTGGDFGVSIFNATVGGLISLELQALEAEGQGKVISSPRVVARDQTKATIRQGTRIPFLTRDTQGNALETFLDATLTLDVTPRVTPDGRIFMEVDVHKNAPIVFNGQTSLDEKSIHTNVLVGNGDTAVLGGIYESTDSTSVSKVPLLGDIPFLGNLFKQKSDSKERTELLLFITPKILPSDPLIK